MLKREIVLDTETTGLSPAEGHRIVEIGCVELINHVPTGQTWHKYLNPEREMPEEARRVHGLDDAFLADKPLFASLAEDFVAFLGEATLVIHNAPFDMGFLNTELEKAGRPALSNPVIDTVRLARQVNPGARASLDALCRHYGIDNSKRDLHGALLDSEILADVYLELIGGRQVAFALSAEAAAAAAGLSQPAPGPALQRPKPLASRLDAEQKKAHAEFISGMGADPIWGKYSN